MGDEVGDLLKSAQTNLSNYSMASRGIMLREMIPPVAKARADLKKLARALEQIGNSPTAEIQETLKKLRSRNPRDSRNGRID